MGHQPETNQCCLCLHLNQPHSKATSLGIQVSNPYQQARGRSNTLFLFIFYKTYTQDKKEKKIKN